MKNLFKNSGLLAFLVALPLIGISAVKRPLADYLEFPPLTRYVQHAGFSWPVFIGLAVAIVAVLIHFVVRVLKSQRSFDHRLPITDHSSPSASPTIHSPFPWWGWLGIAFTAVAWILAWTRFPCLAGLQRFTFTPLWLGYVVVINALTYARTGHCMLTDRPRYLLKLFLLSAGFWWYFEYLNRFVQNWCYEGVAGFSRLEYLLFATLPFSTVLPAVLGTYELLMSMPRVSAGLGDFVRTDLVRTARRPSLHHEFHGGPASVRAAPEGLPAYSMETSRSTATAWLALVVFSVGLALIGVWPDILFPLLWISPLAIIISWQALRGRETVLAGIERGDWRRVWTLAMAALICGFFWEMWNWHSLARWVYTVPFVNRFKIFEMPILGYVGYLPFGLECAAVAAMLAPEKQERESLAEAQSPQRRTTGATTAHQGAEARVDGERLRLDGPDAICSASSAPLREKSSVQETTGMNGGTESGTVRPKYTGVCRYGNALIMAAIAVYFFLAPGVLVIRDIADPALRGEGIPAIAWRIHRKLAPRMEKWARQRVASGKAANLYLYDVPSTEWPMFGSVYYLWATESLQAAWEKDHSLSREAPRVYARGAVEALTDLVLDPAHHTWVKTHWGEDYMHTNNVFFRTLVIAALTSRESLAGDGRRNALLRDQADSLAAALDASPHGVLEDYPTECYPIDVFAAIACIRRADKVLGTDHGAFIARARRGFEGAMLDKRGLIPYVMDYKTGDHQGPSRGIGNSYVLIFAPELWPDMAKQWYAAYEKDFWQHRWWAAGFREYPREVEPEFAAYVEMNKYFEVDAGPIIGGFSPAANAFGLAAAKVNGRLDHAFTLGAQVLTACWPLPNGRLLGPSILSDPVHAPYLGETCLLFFLAQQPAPGVSLTRGGHLAGFVYLGLLFYFASGLLLICAAWSGVAKWRRHRAEISVSHDVLQFGLWLALLIAAIALAVAGQFPQSAIAVLVAQFLPRAKRK